MMYNNQKIPEGWSIKKLGEMGKFVSGGTPDTEKPEYWNGDIIWLTPSEITKLPTRFVSDSERKITRAGLKNSSAVLLPVGSLIICTRATVGDCCINIKEVSTNQGFKNLIPENSNIDFLYYLISSHKTDLIRKACGSTFLEISKHDIEKLKYSVPPLSEQEKIAEILGTWDLAIEKLTALIEQKKLLKKGLMQRLLNFKKEYLKRFDEIFEDYSDKKHSDKDLLSATQENGVIPRRLLKGRVMSPEGSLDGYKLVQSGSFVISLRSFQGGLEYSDYEGIISPAYTVLKDKISINKCFYRYFFKSYNFIEKYLSIAVIGIRDGKQISYPDLQSVKIPYPPLSEQKAIADILSKADEEIDLLTRKLDLLQSQKKGLMQQLLTGKIRVKVA